MKIKKGMVISDVAGTHVAVPTGPLTETFRGMIRLNDTALLIWNELDAGKSEDEICTVLYDTYDVDKATARQSIAAMVTQLTEAGLLEP